MLAICGCVQKPDSVSSSTKIESIQETDQQGDSRIMAVSFLENRVKEDPDDIIALNKLSGYYLQLYSQTEETSYLKLALEAAQSSLKILPPDQNLGGLYALAHAEFGTHNFRAARDHAKELREYEPKKSNGYELLGDSLLELGEYEQAFTVYHELEKLAPLTVATQSRLARLKWLKGNVDAARRHYSAALDQAIRASIPSSETIAWCHWQFGELLFAEGQFTDAQRSFRAALQVLPEYSHATTSLAQTRAALGDTEGAILLLEQLLRQKDDAHDAAFLGDLYKLSGREQDAERMYEKVAVLTRDSSSDPVVGKLYNRHLVTFWANHDLQREQAYALARSDYSERPDIYSADALAWAALKFGRIKEAQEKIEEALRLGTLDATLLYHAGMIALSAGDQTKGRAYLQKALTLNPHFDPLQSHLARKALAP